MWSIPDKIINDHACKCYGRSAVNRKVAWRIMHANTSHIVLDSVRLQNGGSRVFFHIIQFNNSDFLQGGLLPAAVDVNVHQSIQTGTRAPRLHHSFHQLLIFPPQCHYTNQQSQRNLMQSALTTASGVLYQQFVWRLVMFSSNSMAVPPSLNAVSVSFTRGM